MLLSVLNFLAILMSVAILITALPHINSNETDTDVVWGSLIRTVLITMVFTGSMFMGETALNYFALNSHGEIEPLSRSVSWIPFTIVALGGVQPTILFLLKIVKLKKLESAKK